MKHTPGPWNLEYPESLNPLDASRIEVYTTDESLGGDVVIVADVNKCINAGQANAQLIAAAPEMYEALRWLLHLCSGISKGGDETPVTNHEWVAAWSEAIKAINKAEGEVKPNATD